MAEKTEIKVEGGLDPEKTKATPDEDPKPSEDDPQNGKEGEQSEEDKLWEGIEESHPVRELVDSLRKENASKRTNAKAVREENEALKTKLGEAKSQEDFDAAIADWTSKVEGKEVELLRERIARKHKVSDEFVEFLTGTDEETLKAQAEKLKSASRNPTPQGDPVGGRTPKSEQPDPTAYAEKIRNQRSKKRRR